MATGVVKELICRRGVLKAFLVAVIVIASAANAQAKGHHSHKSHKHHQHISPPQTTGPTVPVSSGVSLDGIGSDSDNAGARSRSGVSENFYASTCPQVKSVVSKVVQRLIRADITLPAAWLRVHFHDCFVQGCDASVLINGSDPNTELNAFANKGSLRGLQQLEQIKVAVENVCPGVVSCADIIALAARDAIYYLSGAFWRVPLGRRDGLASNAAAANAALPSPFSTYSQLVAAFQAVGLSERDMVILSGAHTIGFTHCSIILGRIYNFPGSPDGVDPTLNKNYATRLQRECPQGASGNTLIPLDPTGGNQTFDSQYFVNVLRNKGLLLSDAALITDADAVEFVEQQAGNIISPNGRFFYAFGNSMEKMGRLNLLTGDQGEIRQHCYAFNSQSS